MTKQTDIFLESSRLFSVVINRTESKHKKAATKSSTDNFCSYSLFRNNWDVIEFGLDAASI